MATLQARLGTPGTGPLPTVPTPPVPVHATDEAIRTQHGDIAREVLDLRLLALQPLPAPPRHLRGWY